MLYTKSNGFQLDLDVQEGFRILGLQFCTFFNQVKT